MEQLDPLDADVILQLDALDADAARSILERLDAASLARFRAVNQNAQQLVDSLAADLLARHMRELRQRATCRRTCVPRGAQPPASFVGIISAAGPIHLIGGMCCAGLETRRSLHGHMLGGACWKAASFCGAQTLLIRASDGALVGHGPGISGAEVFLSCRCDADCNGEDGCAVEDVAEEAEDEEEAMREQEEEAASRGWAWRRPTASVSLGLEHPLHLPSARLLALPEPAAMACACPGRSHVLGESGCVYSARWLGTSASSGPSASPWTCWRPPTPSQRVIEISALSAHVLLRTVAGSALSFGDPQDGKLGFFSKTAFVTTPRLVEALSGHTVAGIAAGARHSLFLTLEGACFAAGKGDVGQCGRVDGRAWRRMWLPAGCAPLVQVAAGHAHSLLLDHTGRVFACGLNSHGQCGVRPEPQQLKAGGARVECVPEPTLVSGLLPHAVRAMEAGAFLSAFEVQEITLEEEEEEEGGAPSTEGSPAPNAGQVETTTATTGARTATGGCGDDGVEQPSFWLAGNVEAFNIPGTVTQVSGLRFMPSCYQWQSV